MVLAGGARNDVHGLRQHLQQYLDDDNTDLYGKLSAALRLSCLPRAGSQGQQLKLARAVVNCRTNLMHRSIARVERLHFARLAQRVLVRIKNHQGTDRSPARSGYDRYGDDLRSISARK